MNTTLTARGIVAAADTTCPRVSALADNGYTAAAAATDLFGLAARSGSAFAFAEGYRFEASLIADGGMKLQELYGAPSSGGASAATETSLTVVDLDSDAREEDHGDLVATTIETILAAVREGTGPDLLLQAPIELHLPGRVELLRPDVLFRDGKQWQVGEVKAYLDRDGYTDGAKIKTAALQAATTVVALRELLTRNGLAPEEADAAIPSRVDLILRRNDFDAPSRRTLSSAAEVAQVRALLARLRTHPAPTATRTWSRGDVLNTAHEYSSACEQRCPLAPACRGQARAADPTRELFGGAGIVDLETAGVSVPRAHELAAGAPPCAGEEALAAALAAGYSAAHVVRVPVTSRDRLAENGPMGCGRTGETQ